MANPEHLAKLREGVEVWSLSAKLRVLEEIWDDLCRTPESVPVPSWHGDVLTSREKRAQEGSSQFTDWAEAKQRIRDSVR